MTQDTPASEPEHGPERCPVAWCPVCMTLSVFRPGQARDRRAPAPRRIGAVPGDAGGGRRARGRARRPGAYRTRPSGEDRHRMTEPTAVGIDVGATKAEAVLVTGEGTIHARALADTPATDGPAVLEAMRSAAEQVRDPNAVAIGVGAAGLVELGTGRMRFAPNIAWRDVDLREVLARARPADGGRQRLHRRRGRRAARGRRPGRRRSPATSGSGPGSAAGSCSAARSSAAPTGSPARSGTSSWSRAGVVCGCGNRGCWETVASGSAISRLGRERLGLDGHGVVAAPRAATRRARAILEEVGAPARRRARRTRERARSRARDRRRGTDRGRGRPAARSRRAGRSATRRGGRPTAGGADRPRGARGRQRAVGAALWALQEAS